ncbi:MAG TPA: tetratricopeptide repeat protein [Steroidobacteraceae bacterium]
MLLPAWNERALAAGGALRVAQHTLRRAAVALAGSALAALAACSSEPVRPAPRTAPPPEPPAARATPAPPQSVAAGAATPTVPAAAPARAARPEVPPAARADFNRAVGFMRAGNTLEAELGFKQIALQYPQFAAPLVNLGILQRKDGHLEQAEETLKNAVAHESGSAVAWTELGATQRMRGKFKDAASSYEQAIAADPRYAPAWRNLGVLSDLYLGDPSRALTAFEQYRQLTGEDKPVSGWIAELRQRLGIAPVTRPEPAAPGAAPGTPPGKTPGAAAPSAPASEPRAAPEPQSQPAPGESHASAAPGGSPLRAGG